MNKPPIFQLCNCGRSSMRLTGPEWQMLLRRRPSPELHHRRGPCPGQARFTESWQERLERIGLDRINLVSLSINYPSTSSLTGPLDWAAALTARMASATTAAYCRSDTSV